MDNSEQHVKILDSYLEKIHNLSGQIFELICETHMRNTALFDELDIRNSDYKYQNFESLYLGMSNAALFIKGSALSMKVRLKNSKEFVKKSGLN